MASTTSQPLKERMLDTVTSGKMRASHSPAHKLSLHKGLALDEAIISACDNEKLKFCSNLSSRCSRTGKKPILDAAGTALMAWKSNKDSDVKKAVLLVAALKGELDFFKEAELWLYKGKRAPQAIVSARDKNGNGPLHYAASAGKNDICRYLIQCRHLDPNISTNTGKTPIMLAAFNGHECTIKYLIENGANIYQRASDGLNSVHHATLNVQHKALKALVSKGGPVDAEHLTGAPLLLAAYYCDATSMKILLEGKANPKISCEFISPLVVSVTVDSKQCVEVLKAEVDLSEVPLLEWAMDSNSTEMVHYLLENGADPNLTNDLGQLPLEIAAVRGNMEIVNILFPITSSRPEWTSIDGLLSYVESEQCKKEAAKEDPTDSTAQRIQSLCWGRLSSALDASQNSMTDSDYEEAIFALIGCQL